MVKLDDLLSQLPLDQLAGVLGVEEDQAKTAIGTAIPALLGGMAANAQDPAGAASLAKAVEQHRDDLLDGGIDLSRIDLEDGSRIVQNVFGDNQDQIIQKLGGVGGGGGGDLIGRLLPMLAPLVMSFLAKSSPEGVAAPAADGGGIGDLLGGLTGGGGGGGGLLDSLLGMFGGGGSNAGGGLPGGLDLDGLVGDLLGGGRR